MTGTQVLARKWRPRSFAELIGQEQVVRALANALDQQRLHHAYLLTSTRGVGKTKVLDEVIGAGVDVVRINLSLGSHAEHLQRAEWVRNRARATGRQVGLLADLQGPKIRIGKFREGAIQLAGGDLFTLDAALPLDSGDQQRVGLTFKRLPNDVARGDTLLLDDGQIVLWVNEVAGPDVRCKVVVGGKLSSNKGLNKQGGGLSAPALTDKDRDDICFAAEVEADYVAVSFVRSAEDVNEARRLLREAGVKGCILAKIERAEAVDAIEEIINASDAIMVARGDLGVELPFEEVPLVQKRIIREANLHGPNCARTPRSTRHE